MTVGRTYAARRAVLTTGVLTATVLAAAAPAGAAIVYELEEDVDDTFPVVCDRGTPDPSDDLSLELSVTGSVSIRVKQRGPGGGLWFEARGSIAETSTNVDNGVSWTATTDFFEHETHAVEVVDATTRRVVSNGHVRFRVYGPSGALDSQRVGLQQVELVVDTLGTPDPGDDDVRFVRVIREVGTDETADDVCDDAVRFSAG